MADLKDTIIVNVEYYTGQEDEDDTGYPYFVASSDDLNFVTDAETFEELMDNIRECVVLCLEEPNYWHWANASLQIIR